MNTSLKPWEEGSEYHWINLPTFSEEEAYPSHALLYSCGRAALAELIKFGMVSLGWKRLWIPTYNCPEVVDTIFLTGIEVAVYFDTPFNEVSAPTNIRHGDVILVVNVFGMKSMADYTDIFQLGIPVIEDHSHDPWSQWAMESRADYNLVSYRKTLPLPGGGAFWSNTGSLLPDEPFETDGITAEIGEKLEAMLLKTIYLAGGISDKKKYLALYVQAKKRLDESVRADRNDKMSISEISRAMLNIFPWRAWRSKRADNHQHLLEQLSHQKNMVILESNRMGTCPFMLTLLFGSRHKRDVVNQRLIERSIYPAIIWPLDRDNCEWAGETSIELSGRMLCIHCDGRYSTEDMDKVAIALSECIDL